jgi:hypothetical protein
MTFLGLAPLPDAVLARADAEPPHLPEEVRSVMMMMMMMTMTMMMMMGGARIVGRGGFGGSS